MYIEAVFARAPKRGLRRLAQMVRRSGAPAPPAERPREAIVSLTFDDGLASQRIAAELLDARGLTGTFYVPSGLVGRKGRFDWDDLRALVAQGHEVGGHTSTHVHLPELARVRPGRDRVRPEALLEHDLDPVTFAYPYGEATPELESIVRDVGYRAARGIGGVVESIPPENGLRLRTPHSARSWTTLEQLTALVHVAEPRGWLADRSLPSRRARRRHGVELHDGAVVARGVPRLARRTRSAGRPCSRRRRRRP